MYTSVYIIYAAAMSLEALRTQMDILKREMGQLEIENRCLREGNSDQESS